MEQNIKDAINAKAKEQIARLPNDPGGLATKELIEEIAQSLTEINSFNDRLIARSKNNGSYYLSNFLSSIFNRHWMAGEAYLWSINSPVIHQLIHRRHLSNTNDAISNVILTFIIQAWFHGQSDMKAFVDFLHKQQFSDKDIVSICVGNGDDVFFTGKWKVEGETIPYDSPLSRFGEYIVPLVKSSSGFLGFGKTSEIKPIIDKAVLTSGNASARTSWLAFLMKYNPDGVPKDVSEFLVWLDYGSKKMLNVPCAIFLIQQDAVRFETDVINAIARHQIDEGSKFAIYRALDKALKGRYREDLIAIGESHLDYYKADNQAGSYYHEPRVFKQRLDEAYLDWLFDANPIQASARLKKFFEESAFLHYQLFNYAAMKFPAEALELLVVALQKDPDKLPRYVTTSYYEALFDLLVKFELALVKNELLKFAVERSGKRTREMACELLVKLGDKVLEDGRVLLSGKTVDERVTGALILSMLPSAEARIALNDGVDKESNDDTRDIMLESLSEERFGKPLTLSQVKEMISLAAKRKKLNKWSEKWIEESNVPALQWEETGDPLDADALRFLFYRMKRAPGLNSDVEARQAIRHIRKTTSGEFAKALVKAFQDSNADVKLKYYLTLAALLGDNEMMSNLNALFTKSMTDKRMKMAEYVVGALAMVGTDKALRLVETIYRKYANKKPAVSQAARAALDAAAKELNITMDELSDRIIPSFDFDGIYKIVTIDGEEFRAFVSDEFKINYFTEDNKTRKSLPSNAPKEIKSEFKDIEKEIGIVTKSQTIRLEKYLVEERRWTSEDWMRFFFNNPIMSVYAMKLLWGVFDRQGNLLNTFYCSQDASLYNVQDEDVSLDPDHAVGILHPLYLSSEQLEAWKQKLYEMSMTTIFPIVDRGVVKITSAEADLSRSQIFAGKDIPKGADFVNTYLVKKSWLKSTGDGGRSDFSKLYKDGLISANANIEGPTAWYQSGTTPAKMHDVGFWSKTTREHVKLKDLPPVFFSEVMSDIESMINAN